ncbi:receptor-like protein kinase FERONIA [Rosa rugosa]|uniref:receptor-like protein kinase FERONIA n=1 Tax=Rosa rugosa TaxID=74645 RepID=UPI002B40BD10|nr:receptor-like protein kinase FERONIA [Rosa rugosa]
MKPIITPLYLYLFLHILTLFVTGQSPPYIPVDNITLACGNSGQSSSNGLRKWSGDIDSKFTPIGTASQSIDAPRSSTASQVPYTKARLSRSKFTYTIPLSPGQKFIRLHFNPDTYNPDFQRSNSLFSVTAAGFILLKNFNASGTADASRRSPLVREFCVDIKTGQRLEITFKPSKDAYAFINGIEIVSMPTGLYYTSSVKLVGTSASTYPIGINTALEMVYRINVGGGPISPEADTGMYRNWDTADEIYLDDVSKKFSVLPQNNTIELNFVKVPKYSAPKPVYITGRSMGMNKTINKSYNLTWRFPLDPKFYYLVRLHFCEFESDITEYRDRAFQIFMANQTAENIFDVIQWSGANGNPVYRDYVVGMFTSPVGSEKKVNLSLALSALKRDWYTTYNDAILNGLEIFKLSDPSGNLAGPNLDPPLVQPNSPSKKKSTPMAAIIAGVVSGLIMLSLLGFFVFRRGRKAKDYSSSQVKWGLLSFPTTTKSTTSYGSSLPSELCHRFSLAEIRAATQNFDDSNVIGVGGFGNVYKGTINGASTPFAIKRLKAESSQGALEFKTEIELLSQLRHVHLVSLVGYCDDNGEMILVYDYMENGTLRDHLYDSENPPLPWEQRLQVCIGAARGLHYLHTGVKCMIIHRDVKSTNILLDDKWVAKVADFGLSKMGTTTMSKTHISTMVKGSFGYLDPEYYRRQQLTEKSDVYSFGVVLCEVLCARPALIRTADKKQMNLAAWFTACHGNGTLDQIIDPNLRGKIVNECLNKFVEIAISCMHDNRSERPSMNDVVWELECALKLQQTAEGSDLNFNAGKKGEDEASLVNDSDAGFSGTWEDSSGSKNSKMTETSTSYQNSSASDSIKGLSGTVFSEIDPNGR